MLKHFSVNLHEFSVKFISNLTMNDDTAARVKVCSIGNRTTPQFNNATGYMRRFGEKVRKIMVNLINVIELNKCILVIDVKHCFFRILTMTFQPLPLFCLQRCVRYCTLSSERFGAHSIT